MLAAATAVRVPAGPVPPCATLTGPAAPGNPPSSLITWYLGLIPHWMGPRPRAERRLLLRTHEWIVDRIAAREATLTAAAADLRPDGALTRILSDLVPADETGHWHRFIELLVARLRDALLVPVSRRNEAWVRWLFLITYSIPAPSLPGQAHATVGLRPSSGARRRRVHDRPFALNGRRR